MSERPTCVVILSCKSGGSSALQDLLCKYAGARHVEHTRHVQHETLYWTKAASILGREQIKIPGSEVPIPPRKALRDIRNLLTANLPHFVLPSDPRELVFEGWRQLCCRFGPVFVEKSPHHLHQWAALDLLLEAVRSLPETDFRFVGLVRNPMDVLYSMWRRWRTDPVTFQHHWRLAYENLLRLKQRVADQLLIVRYEDLAAHGNAAHHLIEFIDQPPTSEAEHFIHAKSLQRWKNDQWFGFQLDPQVERLAGSYGYSREDLLNRSFALWGVYRALSRLSRQSLRARWNLLKREIRNRR